MSSGGTHTRKRHDRFVLGRTTHGLLGFDPTVASGADALYGGVLAMELIGGNDILGGSIDGETHILPGSLVRLLFADTIIPPEVVTALPTLPNASYPQGCQVFLTTDMKLYRNSTGSLWVRSTDGADILADSITAGQIAVGAIGADELAANSVTAVKLLVGWRAPTIDNADFEIGAVGSSTVPGWFVVDPALTFIRGKDTFGGDTISGKQSVELVGPNGGSWPYIRSVAFPVKKGSKVRLSALAAGDTSNSCIMYFSFDVGGLVAARGNSAVGTDFSIRYGGVVTVPDGASTAQILLQNSSPGTQRVRFDDVQISQEDDLLASSGSVEIGAAGITVTNGKITVKNPGGTVVIDGTSNMFKIAATGTLTNTQADGAEGYVTATLSGLGALATTPAHVAMLGFGAASGDRRQGNPNLSWGYSAQLFAASASGGSPTTKVLGWTTISEFSTILDGSSFVVVELFARNRGSGVSNTFYARYYVLQEAAI